MLVDRCAKLSTNVIMIWQLILSITGDQLIFPGKKLSDMTFLKCECLLTSFFYVIAS